MSTQKYTRTQEFKKKHLYNKLYIMQDKLINFWRITSSPETRFEKMLNLELRVL